MTKTAENAVNVVISLECASQSSGRLKSVKKRVELPSYVENEENDMITIRVKARQSLNVHTHASGRSQASYGNGYWCSSINCQHGTKCFDKLL